MSIFKRKKDSAREEKRPFTSAVIVAAGNSTRMMGEDKITAPLGGSPLIARTISAFEQSGAIDEIVIVTREELIPGMGRLCADFGFKKVLCVIKGGASRAQSVQRGLLHISRRAELVAVHDGARPLVTDRIICEAVALAASSGAAVPAVAVKDTVKRAVNGIICETPPRNEFFAAQTPQVFKADVFKAALFKALEDGKELTDDASAMELLGMSVSISTGSEENIKITTPADIAVAEAILERRARQQ